ncbi:hypothetical protein ETAA8_02290 [Anatilimnocola aggregata]|uniref:Uncharacterized protein n=1 Tax=Anatilimnocola aggregata TaxID=2528021 RepID=A0A517Y4L7_9BACT|nr:hypothetical protein [Anatilimnocola aggregata]QDU25167.1 hypothetical protein ETAA8_02290 [Anatilimnocola aggregata]
MCTKLEIKPERISIALLMLWTTMSAVLLAIDRATNDNWHGQYGLLFQGIAFVFSPLWGAGAVAVLLMLWRFATGGPTFPSQPGHWLLVIFGITSTTAMFLRFVVLSGMNTLGLAVPTYAILRIVTLGVALVLYIIPMRRFTGCWRATFAVGGLIGLVLLISVVLEFWEISTHFITYRIEWWANWLVLGLVALAVVDDLRNRRQRDNLHAVGVFVRIAFHLLIAAMPLIISLVMGF